jgi:Methyltransferase domain
MACKRVLYIGDHFSQGYLVKKLFKILLPVIDVILAPIVYPASFLLKLVRIAGVQRMPFCKRVLMQVGVFPIRDHYFEPLFNVRSLKYPLEQMRNLPGFDLNSCQQLELLEKFRYSDELGGKVTTETYERTFSFDNKAFGPGDAEFLYNLIRLKKPSRIIEIGSGHSTLMALKAIRKNMEDDSYYACRHLCIEPYEQLWLEKTNVTIIRQRVEDVDRGIFSELDQDDLLFIDSSHVIRPQGDVLFEYLELLPTLKTGVIVHIHDIFSPRDYPKEWVIDEVRLWNEQYLLEAFLTENHAWNVLGALNYLHHNHYEQLRKCCSFLTRDCEPGSFYIQRIA